MKFPMQFRLVAAGILPLLLMAQSPPPSAGRPAELTQEQIEKLVETSKYKDALDGITQVMGGKNADMIDRVALLKLRAECQLQLKQGSAAIDSLEAVRKQAAANNSKKEAASAQSFVVLIRRSPGGIYKPKSAGKKAPLNILDASERLTAFDELFVDELGSCQKATSDAAGGENLKPIFDTAARVSDVVALERFTAGKTTESAALAKNLAAAANSVMQNQQDDFNRLIELTSLEAHQVVQGRGRRAVEAGLSPRGVAAMQLVITTNQQIVDSIPNIREQLDQSMILENVKSRAARQQVRARAVLDGRVDPGRGLAANTKDPPNKHEPFSD